MPKTTAENLRLIEKLRAGEDGVERVGGIALALEAKARQLKGDEPGP